MRLAAAGDIVGVTDNHMDQTVALYAGVDPAVKGLALVAQAADARLVPKMNSGAASLRTLFGVSIAVGAIGALFAGWSAWAI
jgi:hypothetical protein